jgi:hypothetical protein
VKRRGRGLLTPGQMRFALVALAVVAVLLVLDATIGDDAEPPSLERRAEMVDTCVKAGISQYEKKETDPYLVRQAPEDVERFWKRACAELDRRGQLDQGRDGAPAGELRKTAGEVLQRMIDRGEMPQPASG